MTDFLTSLTARSFGREAVARPRLASLFEPVRHRDTTLQEAPAMEPNETAIAKEIVAESDGKQEKRGVAPAARGESQAGGAIHAAKEGPFAAIVQPTQVDSARVGTTTNKDKRWEDAAVVAASAPVLEASFAQRENANPSVLPLHSDIEEISPRLMPTKESSAAAARVEALEKNNHEIVLPSGVVAELTAQMKNAVLALNPGPAAPARKNVDRPAQAMAAESEPSVHVTIGRIEVRATAESRQDGRPRSASPVMSLEEYLRRRQRGGQ
jgi:hypothetical protein